MFLKQHILAALREEFDQWQQLLDHLEEGQTTTPLLPSPWSIKDVLAHLMAWQKRSTARMQAAALGTEPDFHLWPDEIDPEGDVDRANAWIYNNYRDLPWSSVHAEWKEGFERFLASIEPISEPLLLGTEVFPWIKPYPLVIVPLGSYDHHQEHYETSLAWLREHAGFSFTNGGH